MNRERVGFIGLGIMGAPMAANLLEAGFEVTVFNRTRERMDPLVEAGARASSSPAELAAASDLIVTIVSDSPDVEAVIAGDNGVCDGVREGSIVIDMSTVSPEMERRLDRLLRDRGAELVDAPVSGGDVGAREGTLAIMAGGTEAAFDRARPIFEVLGRTVTYCGPVGHGQLTKLCNQILVSVNLLAVCEAISFARASGLDAETMLAAVGGGAAGSWQLANLGPRIIAEDFAPGFMVDLMQKDLRLVMGSTGGRAGLSGTGLVHQLFNALQASDGGRQGTQALARIVDRLSSSGADS